MKNYVRAPWNPPLEVRWADILNWRLCYDWAMYWFGMRKFGIGLKERGLLMKATQKVFHSRSSQIISGWDFQHDIGEIHEHPLMIRVGMRKRVCLTLHAWEGVGVTFNIPQGNLYPDSILAQFIPAMGSRVGVIACTIQEVANNLRRTESGINSRWVSVRYQEVSIEQLMLTDWECERDGASKGH